jgi:deoxyribodipyrimidine photo-lyase
MNDIAIHWFRKDLRLSDNPSLVAASKHSNILPIYIFDDTSDAITIGSASKWWLNFSLQALSASLDNNLSIYKGDPIDILKDIIFRLNIKAVYWNRCYEPWQIERDKKIKRYLDKQNIKVCSFNGSLLWEPWEIKNTYDKPYGVFTPFYRKGCLQAKKPRIPLPSPKNIHYIFDSERSIQLQKLNLLSNHSWHEKLKKFWSIGEDGADFCLEKFIEKGLSQYKKGRNIPAKPYVSRISPHLNFGEISPNQLWYRVLNERDDKNSDHFCSELGWREFAYNQLFHHPTLPTKNLQSKFDSFLWVTNEDQLYAWKKGQTGIPMVDAGMRELWQTGYMHNRTRMIVGSFLVKNLRIHWNHGERWFWETLVDADLANNSASWQWVAGCGSDAAPYFRIFNPVLQGQKFDADGEYVRRYIPEISLLPNEYLFCPWSAPESILTKAKIILGETYPNPIVNLKLSREAALTAFKEISAATQ